MGTRELHLSREIFIDEADFKEEANQQFKRLVLGKEVRCATPTSSRANESRRMRTARSPASTALTTRDPGQGNRRTAAR
ncbi:hypothetical protein ACNKHQ_03650 [Shigella flexneri]